jgi:WD40 repeat protein
MNLAAANPRWAAAFEMVGGEAKDVPEAKRADREATVSAIKRILGDDLPERRLNAALKRCGNTVGFSQFCEITADMQRFMAEGKEAGMDAAEAEEAEIRRDSKLKVQQEPDVFEILGMRKSKDVAEIQARKDQAMKNVGSEAFKAGGLAVLASRRFVRGVGARREARAITVAGVEAGKEPAAERRRFEVVPGPSAKRKLTVKAAVRLQKDLPQMQVRSTGAACFVLRFSPDGSQIAGGFYDGGLRIYDVDTASMEHCLNLPKFMGGTYSRMSLREPGDLAQVALERKDRLAGETMDESGRKQTDGVRERVAQMSVVQEPAITNLRWRPTRASPQMVATVDSAGAISLWEIYKRGRDPRCVARVNANKGSLYACAFTESGSKLVVGGAERVLRVYDVQTLIDWAKAPGNDDGALCPCETIGNQDVLDSNKITSHSARVMSICPHPQNEHVLFSAGMDKKILMWDTRVGGSPVGIITGLEMGGDALDVSRDGLALLAGSHRTKTPLEVYDLHRSVFENATKVVDASHPLDMTAKAEAAVHSGDATARTHRYSWRADEAPFEGPARASVTGCLVFSAAWDSDNRTIVAAGENDNLARVYTRHGDGEATTLEVVGTCLGEDHAFWSAAVAADGRTCAFGAADGAVVICQVR